MKAAQFEYHAPSSIEETVAALHEHGDDAKLLAGGQSLVPILAMRLARFGHLIDLNRIADLASATPEDEWLTIGAMTRQATAERSAEVARLAPLLSRALPYIGHFQIRNRGTIGGSISHADPCSELPAVASALGAEMELRSHQGTRRVQAADFFSSIWETALAPEELLVSVRFPIWGAHCGFSIEEIAWRRGDFAIVGVVCAVRLTSGGVVDRAGVAFMGMGPTPLRASAAETSVLHKTRTEIELDSFAELAIGETSPIDDVHASAAYRKQVGRTLVRRALASALEEASRG